MGMDTRTAVFILGAVISSGVLGYYLNEARRLGAGLFRPRIEIGSGYSNDRVVDTAVLAKAMRTRPRKAWETYVEGRLHSLPKALERDAESTRSICTAPVAYVDAFEDEGEITLT